MATHLSTYLLPEGVDDRNVLKQAIFRCLRESTYYHARVQQVFLAAGFVVRRAEKDSCHPVWNLRLQRGTFDLSHDSTIATRQIRKLLKEHGLKVERDAICVAQNGNTVTCNIFVPDGCEGRLS